MVKDRADKILTEKGLVSSRSQAKSMIENGHVKANGVIIKKAGELIELDAEIKVEAPTYVGRGAFKLEKALSEFNVDIRDKIFLDVGASTGGFTEVLLNAGAKKVYAIDVGHNQLAQKLRDDQRVINLEGTNIKNLEKLPELAAGAVVDLSFISVTKVIDNIKNLLGPGADIIILIKPQFEAGPERIPKDGVIKDDKIRAIILQEVVDFLTSHGCKLIKSIESPIEGKSGNKEFLSWFVHI